MATAISNLLDHDIITFDVWNTLIKANPEFSRLRTHEIAKFYAITFEEAKEAYTSVKHFLDQSAEIACICMSTPQCWQLLDVTIQRLRRKQGLIAVDVGLDQLVSNCNQLFRQYPPIFTEDTRSVLRELQTRGKILGIISNTNFIPGDLLREVLFAEDDVFSSYFFSDSDGLPKPHAAVFTDSRFRLIEAYWEIVNTNAAASSLKLVHVGDNLVCDGNAVAVPGFLFQHVEDPSNLVEIFKQAGL